MKPATGARAIRLALSLALALTWVASCQNPPGRASSAAEEPRPPAHEAPPPTVETRPPTPAAEPGEQTRRDSRAPGGERQPTPDYLSVLERYHADEPAYVEAQTTLPDVLVIETQNVRRLRLERARVPLRVRGSIVLRLDGQGIEWTADSQVVEFERSVNGLWTPIRPPKR